MALKDTDGDGIPDIKDNLPNYPNPSQASGTGSVNKNNGMPSFESNIQGIVLPDYPAGRFAKPDEAKNWFKFLKITNKPAYDNIVKNMIALGIPEKKWQSAWDDAVDWTQTVNAKTGDPRGYFSLLDPADYEDTSPEPKKYGTSISNQTNVTQYSKSSAAQDINTAYKAELGIEAGVNDINAYQTAVNEMAAKNPSVAKYTTTTSAGTAGAPMGTSTTKSTTSTGFDPNRFAVEYARSNPDYAENFAVKSFLKLIDQSLTDPNRIGLVVE